MLLLYVLLCILALCILRDYVSEVSYFPPKSKIPATQVPIGKMASHKIWSEIFCLSDVKFL